MKLDRKKDIKGELCKLLNVPEMNPKDRGWDSNPSDLLHQHVDRQHRPRCCTSVFHQDPCPWYIQFFFLQQMWRETYRTSLGRVLQLFCKRISLLIVQITRTHFDKNQFQVILSPRLNKLATFLSLTVTCSRGNFSQIKLKSDTCDVLYYWNPGTSQYSWTDRIRQNSSLLPLPIHRHD